MSAVDYFFIIGTIYMAHETAPKERLVFGGFCMCVGLAFWIMGVKT